MKYIGVPRCPYCRKRVGFLRTWKLKREGEYRCPRCGGISNIYLSPLIYVLALLAVFAGGALYFFHKFILDDISPMTAVEVIIPFAVFFLLSLLFVYLEKPALKKVKRNSKGRVVATRKSQPVRKPSRNVAQTGSLFREDDFMPQGEMQTGPIYSSQDDYQDDMTPYIADTDAGVATNYYDTGAPADYEQPIVTETPAPAPAAGNVARHNLTPAVPVQKSVPASSVEISEDFFSKYNDPEYIKRRMEEIKDKKQ